MGTVQYDHRIFLDDFQSTRPFRALKPLLHASFWDAGLPALMVTDTAPFRYPYYHSEEDTPEKLSYDSLARVVVGLEKTIAHLVVPAE